jgi:hypothetical protein
MVEEAIMTGVPAHLINKQIKKSDLKNTQKAALRVKVDKAAK